MKKALLVFVAVLFCTGWSTSDDKATIGDGTASDKTIEADIGSGATNPKMKFDSTGSQWQFSNDGSAFLPLGSGGGGAGGVNLLETENWDFELGDQKWTESAGTFAVTTGAVLVGFDSTSGSMDFSGASQTLSSEAVVIPNGLKENSCMVSAWTRWPAGTSADIKLQAYDGSNVLVELDISASSTWQETFAAFSCPDSGSLTLRFESQVADPEIIYIDNVHIGSYTKLIDISQAEVYGTAVWDARAACKWSSTSATWAAFAVDADCDFTDFNSTGKLEAPSTKIPAFKMDVSPGNYIVTVQGDFAGDTATCGYRLHDGTTNSGFISSKDTGAGSRASSLVGYFNYTNAASAVTFQIQIQMPGGGTCSINNSTITNDYDSLQFNVMRFPSATEKAISLDTQGASWSGYHDSTCIFSRTNAAYGDFTADASCSLVELLNNSFGAVSTYGSALPGIVFTPRRAGVYYVCAVFAGTGSTALASQGYELSDLTPTIISEIGLRQDAAGNQRDAVTLCGIYNALSTSSTTIRIRGKSTAGTIEIRNGVGSTPDQAVYWTIFPISQSFPQAVLIPDVVSMVRLDTGDGFGDGTHSKIRDMTNVTESVGTCISQNVSGGGSDNNGVEITINCDGKYTFSYADFISAGTGHIGFSLNSTNLTTSVQSLSASERLMFETTTANVRASVTVSMPLSNGDVLRPHTAGAVDDASDGVQFIITRVH